MFLCLSINSTILEEVLDEHVSDGVGYEPDIVGIRGTCQVYIDLLEENILKSSYKLGKRK